MVEAAIVGLFLTWLMWTGGMPVWMIGIAWIACYLYGTWRTKKPVEGASGPIPNSDIE